MDKTNSRRRGPMAVAVLVASMVAGGARAAPVPPGFWTTAAPTPAVTLGEADAALEGGDLDRAAALYESVERAAPGSLEAAQARRALKILEVTRARSPAMSPRAAGSPAAGRASATPGGTVSGSAAVPATPIPASPPPGPGDDLPDVKPAKIGGDTVQPGVVIRREPYSTRTEERLRLTIWEKVDFGVTAFVYGLSEGFSFGLSSNSHNGDDVTTPAALGALLYTGAAVAYLSAANPDRGDLPLALGITSYLPTTTLLLSNILYDHPKDTNVALAVAATGVLSIPIALVATRSLDLDPGDTQLVRDAGFWGLLLATTGTLAWGGSDYPSGYGYTYHQDPSSRRLSIAGALGLYGGLGLGALAAANSEVSLERVRVSTWGGYGGGLVGLLVGTNKSQGSWAGITIGSLIGLVVTFAATGSLDGIPSESTTVASPARGRRRTATANILPSIIPVSLAGAPSPIPTLGFSGTM